ncbi:MAG: GatB/YqeY domain-containing protein [Thermoleophilaceae bacterium]|jgi:uncharacterized protein YqeY
MSILERIQADTRNAMRDRDRDRVGALRMLSSELQKALKEGDGGADEAAVLQRERKRRLEASDAYREAGRDDLARGEEREAAIVEEYLPRQLSDDELGAIVGDVVARAGAASPREMGKVMSLVMPEVQGRADGKRVSAMVRDKLSA